MLTCDEYSNPKTLTGFGPAAATALTALRRDGSKRPGKGRLARKRPYHRPLPYTAGAPSAQVDGVGRPGHPPRAGRGAGCSWRALRPAPYTSAPRVKIRRSSAMHRPARSSRTKAGWTEPQQRQACITVGWSWQARSAEQDVGLGRTEVTTRRYNSLGRLLAVARCARSARAGARYAKLWGGALSPTSRQHAYKSAVLALGLPSYPP